jgi:hypothetical protein
MVLGMKRGVLMGMNMIWAWLSRRYDMKRASESSGRAIDGGRENALRFL